MQQEQMINLTVDPKRVTCQRNSGWGIKLVIDSEVTKSLITSNSPIFDIPIYLRFTVHLSLCFKIVPV